MRPSRTFRGRRNLLAGRENGLSPPGLRLSGVTPGQGTSMHPSSSFRGGRNLLAGRENGRGWYGARVAVGRNSNWDTGDNLDTILILPLIGARIRIDPGRTINTARIICTAWTFCTAQTI